jgi:hypothetical protein
LVWTTLQSTEATRQARVANASQQRGLVFEYCVPFGQHRQQGKQMNITPETEPIIRYSFSMFILSLLVLMCFFNIVGYILSIYLINKYNIETKFPKFKRYINFYISTNN